MTLHPSARSSIDPFRVMEIVAAAAERESAGEDVLHLEVGQPSTGAPAGAVQAATRLLADRAPLGYTPACGIAPLRDRIAELYYDRYGVPVETERVIVTAGASAGVVLSVLAAFDPGDRVVVTEPGYPCYRQIMQALGIEPVPVRIGPEDGFLLSPAALDTAAESAPLDGVVIASPANPTGTVYDAAQLTALDRWSRDHGVRLIADEIYHGITFEGSAPTATGLTTDNIVIGSFSKYFSMTGWRLGWLVAPPDLIEGIDRLSQNLYLSPPTLAQHAAIGAFGDTVELDAHVNRYRLNRDRLTATLNRIGVSDIAPCDGAFYLYGNVSSWGIDSRVLVDRWLDEIGVATAPGIDFDPVDGHRWIRWSLAGSTADVTEAAKRLESWAVGQHRTVRQQGSV
ncbi:MAG: aminotransferase class I/II-fold pyridoxal phosphate-dependent enzyme [Microthrixaceae bacterium]|nr:aminotransferase class I/II-fold pyridoxal phosphate-dependent enzyme [Microthrixaceae bacterium]